MNNTTSITVQPTPSQALLIVTIIGMLSIGILGMVCSIITVIVISTNKSLNSPCFTLITGGSTGSFVVASFYFSRGLDKLGLELELYGFGRPGWKCLLIAGILGLWGLAYHAQMACLIAIDRLISVTAPMKYRQLGKRYSMGLVIGCGNYCLIQEIAGFATAPLFKDLTCTEFMDALHPYFILTFAKINLCYCIINVLAYTAMMISFRVRQTVHGEQDKQDKFMKQQLAVMPTVKLMVTLYLVTGVLAEVLVNVALNIQAGQASFLLIALAAFLKDASSLVEFVALVLRNKKFRQCFWELVKRNKNEVLSISQSSRNTNGTQRAQ